MVLCYWLLLIILTWHAISSVFSWFNLFAYSRAFVPVLRHASYDLKHCIEICGFTWLTWLLNPKIIGLRSRVYNFMDGRVASIRHFKSQTFSPFRNKDLTPNSPILSRHGIALPSTSDPVRLCLTFPSR